MKALTSGRYDLPHPGHIANLFKIVRENINLLVVVLDYPERSCPVSYAIKVFQEIFDYTHYKIRFISNKTHFGQITKEELINYDCNLYCGGNLEVLKHIENLGFKTKYYERSFDYNARDYKRLE